MRVWIQPRANGIDFDFDTLQVFNGLSGVVRTSDIEAYCRKRGWEPVFVADLDAAWEERNGR